MGTDLIRRQRYIVDHLSHEELRALCANLGVDYARLSPVTRAGKAGALVQLLAHQNRLAELDEILHRRRVRRRGLSLLSGLLPRALLALAAVGGVVLAVWLVYSQVLGWRVSDLDEAAKRVYVETNQEKLDQPVSDDETLLAFVVEPGETGREVASQLKREGLIKDDKLFRYYLDVEGLEVQAGEYWLHASMTPRQIIDVMQRGLVAEANLTIPEGRRLEEIAELVAGVDLNRTEFVSLATTGDFDYDFLAERPPGASLEGYLFPDTYRLSPDTTVEELIDRMLARFGAQVTPSLRALAAEQGLSLYQVVTLASIVEREAVVAAERPVIASVYLNRLALDWKLDADPTVQYPLGKAGDWWPQITVEDYQTVNSPYNTYLTVGLPPGPIANPGLASIEAVLQPAQTDYVYFMRNCDADDGSHWFAETEEEHLTNYARCTGE